MARPGSRSRVPRCHPLDDRARYHASAGIFRAQVMWGLEKGLHDGYVEPLVELAADLAFDADQLETA